MIRSRAPKIQWAPRRKPAPPPRRRVLPHVLLMPVVIVLASALVAIGLLPAFGGVGQAIKRIDQHFLGNAEASLEIPPFPERSTIYASDGKTVLARVASQNRKYVKLESVSEIAREAVLAIEDHAFYQHGPINVSSILRAALANLKAHAIVQGGSTISQQLIKNTQTGAAQTFERKFQEAQDAIRLERTYSKDQILELYLNEVYLANGVYGIGTAAEYYFGEKSPKALTLPQAALLAGMIAAPSRYDPIHEKAAALTRRNEVLNRMLTLGSITSAEYSEAIATPIKLSSKRRDVNAFGTQPFLVDFVRQQILSDPRFGKTRRARERALYEGGLRIFTTLDPRLQREAEGVLRARLPNPAAGPPGNPAAALATIVPQTGAIRVLANSTSYKKKCPHAIPCRVDLASDARRSAGSAFKAFTLVAAMEQHVPTGRVYSSKSPVTIDSPACGHWEPANAEGGGGGFIPLTTATADSVNVVFAQLINDIGPQSVYDAAVAMGIPASSMPDGAVCALTLGAVSTNPLEMTSAYSTLANNGVHCRPYVISRVASRTGKAIIKAKKHCKQVIPPDAAAAVTSLLQLVVTGGTGTAASLFPRPVAGKTGTGNDHRDAWFMGYVPQLATGVWSGYATGEIPMDGLSVLGGGNAFGGTIAAPIWHDYMAQALSGVPIKGFPSPPPQKAGTVPNVVGLKQDKAEAVLTKANFVSIVKTDNSTRPAGVVFQQDPGGGSSAPLGSAVIIFVSNGKAPKPPPTPKAIVPNVIGKKQGQAIAVLGANGFAVAVEYVPAPEKDHGIVLDQAPSGGTRADKGSTVKIVVGKKSEPSPSPSASASGPAAPGGGGGGSGGSAPLGWWLMPGVLLGSTALARRRRRTA
jgi:membrane peptidoglycan carboxypeptidase